MEEPPRFPVSEKWSSVLPSYVWQRQTDAQDVDYVYHGRTENLPRATSKTVRIFLSSTFTDTYTERNLLMKNVFPEMRKYCRDKYDLDFQVINIIVKSVYKFYRYIQNFFNWLVKHSALFFTTSTVRCAFNSASCICKQFNIRTSDQFTFCAK